MSSTAVGTVLVAAVASVPVLIGVALVVAGVVVSRRGRTDGRVPVEAVVVDHTFLVQPPRVTFEYPSPWGPVRAERTVGVPVVRADGVRVVPGDRLTVWVDRRDPHDVSLGPGSAPRLGGFVMVGAGAVLVLAGLAIGLLPLLRVLVLA